MPLPLETNEAVVTPNAIYAPMIQIMCCPIDGRLKTSAVITIAAAKVDNAGQPNEVWTPTGVSKMVHIQDIENLDSDISDAAGQIASVFGGIVGLIGYINSVRKVL